MNCSLLTFVLGCRNGSSGCRVCSAGVWAMENRSWPTLKATSPIKYTTRNIQWLYLLKKNYFKTKKILESKLNVHFPVKQTGENQSKFIAAHETVWPNVLMVQKRDSVFGVSCSQTSFKLKRWGQHKQQQLLYVKINTFPNWAFICHYQSLNTAVSISPRKHNNC